jgi:uncharacterized membrane protein
MSGWLRFFAIVLLVIGVFFRFFNLDQKLYWGDEIATSLRISGFTQVEMEQQVGTGRVVNILDLQKYQYPSPEKTVIDTIKGLALEESQLTPLYFVMVRFWVRLFGNSVAITRSLSTVISLLAFSCLYWLCQELFESRQIGWIAIALTAVSPVHVIYAQEARPYSLWIVTVLLSSAALLRAMRLKTKVSWGIYGITVALGLYTQLFFGLVAIGHGIYVAAIEGFRLSRTLTSYLLTSVVGLLTFTPWLLVIITNPTSETVSWTNTKQTLLSSVTRWSALVSRTFLDLGVSPVDSLKLKIAVVPLILLVLALIIYSVYFLCRSTSKSVWLFVLTLIGSVGLPLIILDFFFQKRYGTTRHLLPSSLGIQLAVAYLLTTKLKSIYDKILPQQLWKIVSGMIIISGVISCTIRTQYEIWWNQLPGQYGNFPQIARIVNNANHPLLISYGSISQVQILGHILNEKIQVMVVDDSNKPEIIDGFSDVFLLNSSELSRSELEELYTAKAKQITKEFWQLETPMK